ncbi:unnamed protein product [Kuraishia capsulata CBS 1993]|uniref:Uncharacterized protein n=1 Tax=Kuraishia capsulata CBS 1993 TaxID=1382522 RepID=W6MQI7_9ASCO|nr:uncharacterized protein KUCA_T00004572001 [Kuraishia capsulata CBS 1993]CDK28588.1 unnamed protein product [Kuraishia capsulata CBS 1993]
MPPTIRLPTNTKRKYEHIAASEPKLIKILKLADSLSYDGLQLHRFQQTASIYVPVSLDSEEYRVFNYHPKLEEIIRASDSQLEQYQESESELDPLEKSQESVSEDEIDDEDVTEVKVPDYWSKMAKIDDDDDDETDEDEEEQQEQDDDRDQPVSRSSKVGMRPNTGSELFSREFDAEVSSVSEEGTVWELKEPDDSVDILARSEGLLPSKEVLPENESELLPVEIPILEDHFELNPSKEAGEESDAFFTANELDDDDKEDSPHLQVNATMLDHEFSGEDDQRLRLTRQQDIRAIPEDQVNSSSYEVTTDTSNRPAHDSLENNDDLQIIAEIQSDKLDGDEFKHEFTEPQSVRIQVKETPTSMHVRGQRNDHEIGSSESQSSVHKLTPLALNIVTLTQSDDHSGKKSDKSSHDLSSGDIITSTQREGPTMEAVVVTSTQKKSPVTLHSLVAIPTPAVAVSQDDDTSSGDEVYNLGPGDIKRSIDIDREIFKDLRKKILQKKSKSAAALKDDTSSQTYMFASIFVIFTLSKIRFYVKCINCNLLKNQCACVLPDLTDSFEVGVFLTYDKVSAIECRVDETQIRASGIQFPSIGPNRLQFEKLIRTGAKNGEIVATMSQFDWSGLRNLLCDLTGKLESDGFKITKFAKTGMRSLYG